MTKSAAAWPPGGTSPLLRVLVAMPSLGPRSHERYRESTVKLNASSLHGAIAKATREFVKSLDRNQRFDLNKERSRACRVNIFVQNNWPRIQHDTRLLCVLFRTVLACQAPETITHHVRNAFIMKPTKSEPTTNATRVPSTLVSPPLGGRTDEGGNLQYRALLDAAPDAMVIVNQAGEIVLLNLQAEKQFGYRRDELLGQHVKNIIPHGFAERLAADALRSAEDALAQQIGKGIELTGQRKDGSDFPIEIMLSPLESQSR
jgi:PAS domain S-box-containing protein